jgi:hypothetical protein
VHELFDARVGRVLYLNGTRVLHDVNDRLDWVLSRLGPFHPVSIHLATVRFHGLASSGRVIDIQNARARLIPHEPDRAVTFLTELVTKQAQITADTIGHIRFLRMIDAYTIAALQANRRNLAITAQRSVLALFEYRKVLPTVIAAVKARLAELT